MNKFFDVIVAGGGPAGLSAAVYAARSGVTVAVVESLGVGGMAAITPTIENYPGMGTIGGYELAQKMEAHARSCGAEFIYSTVTALQDGKTKKVALSSGETLECYALVFALGSEPRKLGVEGEDALLGAGVSYCATCDGNFFRGKTVAVAGGGSHAVPAAQYLLPIAKKVYMIHSGTLPEVAGAERMERAKIVALGGNPLSSLTVEQGGERRTVQVDGLFVEMGYKPATELIKPFADVDKAGYVICDEYMRTKTDGIFAAGDARSKPLRQVVTAASDGAIAGQFAAVYAKKIRLARS